jgi:hypothetical protein
MSGNSVITGTIFAPFNRQLILWPRRGGCVREMALRTGYRFFREPTVIEPYSVRYLQRFGFLSTL